METETAPPQIARERILAAAERLFAADGFDTVGVRAIAAAAKVNIAAVNYHFGSKEALIAALCERHILHISALRGAELDRLEAAVAQPSVEQILTAYIRPAIRFANDAERGNLLLSRLVIGHATRHSESLGPVLRKALTPSTRRFAEALARALPGADHAALAHGLHLTVGAMLHTITCSEKLTELFPDLPADTDADAVTARITTYAAAGLRALTAGAH